MSRQYLDGLLVLVVEPVGEDRRLALISAGMMSLPKSWLVSASRVGFERAHQHVGVEDVDAHRRQRDVGGAGHRRRVLRLLD